MLQILYSAASIILMLAVALAFYRFGILIGRRQGFTEGFNLGFEAGKLWSTASRQLHHQHPDYHPPSRN